MGAERFEWLKHVDNVFQGSGAKIASIATGSVAVTSGFSGMATFGLGEPRETTLVANTGEDIAIAKCRGDGSLLWVRSAGSPGAERPRAVAGTVDGAVVVAGGFSVNSGYELVFGSGEPNQTAIPPLNAPTSYGQDGFIAKYGPRAALSWARYVGGVPADVGALADGTILLGGWFSETAIFALGQLNETTLTTPHPTST